MPQTENERSVGTEKKKQTKSSAAFSLICSSDSVWSAVRLRSAKSALPTAAETLRSNGDASCPSPWRRHSTCRARSWSGARGRARRSSPLRAWRPRPSSRFERRSGKRRRSQSATRRVCERLSCSFSANHKLKSLAIEGRTNRTKGFESGSFRAPQSCNFLS